LLFFIVYIIGRFVKKKLRLTFLLYRGRLRGIKGLWTKVRCSPNKGFAAAFMHGIYAKASLPQERDQGWQNVGGMSHGKERSD
jgi:hypothetical protein